MKLKFLLFVLCALLYGASAKKPFTEIFQVTFPASSSRLVKDTLYRCPYIRDGCQGPHLWIRPINPNDSALHPDTIYLLRKTNSGMDTVWQRKGDWYSPTAYPQGKFILHCSVREPFIFPINVPVTISKIPTDTNRAITLQLGNNELTKTYEIRADSRLSKKQLALIKSRISKCFRYDYSFDFKKPDERFCRDQDLVDKKVVVRRIK